MFYSLRIQTDLPRDMGAWIVFKGSHTEGPWTALRSGREQVSSTKSLTSTSKSSGMGCPWPCLCGGGWSKQGLPGGPLWPQVWILYVTCVTHWPCPNVTSVMGAPSIMSPLKAHLRVWPRVWPSHATPLWTPSMWPLPSGFQLSLAGAEDQPEEERKCGHEWRPANCEKQRPFVLSLL